MKTKSQTVAAVLATAAIFILLAGCTDRERLGVSAIPQNSPSSWEQTPYGRPIGN